MAILAAVQVSGRRPNKCRLIAGRNESDGWARGRRHNITLPDGELVVIDEKL